MLCFSAGTEFTWNLGPRYKLSNKANCSYCFRVHAKLFGSSVAHTVWSATFLWLGRTPCWECLCNIHQASFGKGGPVLFSLGFLFGDGFGCFIWITACLDWRDVGSGCCYCRKQDRFSIPCSVPTCILRTRVLIYPCLLTVRYQEQVIALRTKKWTSHWYIF